MEKSLPEIDPSLTPRCVLVTGAAGGIGRATVQLFAASGWRVIGVDRSPFGELFPQDGFFIQSDISIGGNIRLDEESILRKQLPKRGPVYADDAPTRCSEELDSCTANPTGSSCNQNTGRRQRG